MLLASSNFLVPGPLSSSSWRSSRRAVGVCPSGCSRPSTGALDAASRRSSADITTPRRPKSALIELEEQHKKLLEEGRAEARALKDEAAKIGEQLREELRKQGEEEYRRLVERASADIEASTRRRPRSCGRRSPGWSWTWSKGCSARGSRLRDQEKLVETRHRRIERQAAAGARPPRPGRTGENGSRCLGARACKGLRRRRLRGLGRHTWRALRSSSRASTSFWPVPQTWPGRWRTP